MGKKMLIDATHAEETRVVVVDGQKVDEFDFETIHRRQLAGNIYLAKVTRVEPSLQAAFVDYGGNRHGFLAFAEIHPDYYQIPMADRQALLEEERAYAEAQREDDGNGEGERRQRRRSGRKDSAKKGGDRKGAGAADEAQTERGAEDGQTADEALTASAPEVAPETAKPDMPTEAARADEAAATGAEKAGAAPAEAPAAGASDSEATGEEQSAGQGANKPQAPIAAPVEGKDPTATREIGGMDIVELDAGADDEIAAPPIAGGNGNGNNGNDEAEPYRAADHATEIDDQIESVADEDVSDELRPPRRPRARRYKIQEVIKVRQIMLVQVVKEERGNKGAALTTYLSLAGRYCVLMPNTARGGGISRKITNAADRKKLKEIAGELEVPQGAGLIIRTAGANRTRAEIRRDYEYLFRLWEQIRDLTLKSIAPAPIYEEGNLIKRSIRDLYSREIDEVLVEGEPGYRVAKDFMKMIMPSHARNVKLYTDQMPLFARFQVETYLAGMFNPTVQLKSGGYIVIGITEALVAIDVNSGKATRQGSIEETALQTNMEAAEEIARQLRLRDLAGLIVIDFIDMEERKNNAAVEKKLKEKLKSDRARIQVGRISGFGLLEMSRQRLRPGMLEATTQPCPHCHGTGLLRSDNSLGLTILRALEEEGTRGRSREVLLKAPVGIVNYLINNKREHLAQIEARYGMAIRVEADPALVSPDFTLEKFKTATRIVAPVAAPVVSFDVGAMGDIDTDDEDAEIAAEPVAVEAPVPAAAATGAAGEGDTEGDGEGGRGRRRRRRRRRGGQKQGDKRGAEGTDSAGEADAGQAEEGRADADLGAAADSAPAGPEPSADAPAAAGDDAGVSDTATDEPPKKPARRRRASRKSATEAAPAADASPVEASQPAAEIAGEGVEAEAGEAAPAKKPAPRRRSRRKPAAAALEAEADAAHAEQAVTPEAAEQQPGAQAQAEPVAEQVAEPAPQPAPVGEEAPTPEPAAETPAPAVDAPPAATESADGKVGEEAPETGDSGSEATEEKSAKPRRRGWWAIGR
ncbi:MAG: Rne/Rng family ribonuclease [Pararhodobacter sp.]|nr:Rne/Rng family ribonuclease [Pararhodobacter sp.]